MQTRAPQTRDPWWDNAKMALVTLVVVGHVWAVLPPMAATHHLYDFLYAWHMPAFVFVAGYLSRGFSYRPARLWQLLHTLVVPYLVFESAMAQFRIHVGGEQLEDLIVNPHWPLWFLVALCCWRLMAPIFRALPGGLALAVALSAVAGWWAGETLDLARVFGFLPFFVLGLKATPERLELLRGRLPRTVAVAVFVVIGWLALHTDHLISTEWLYYRSQYGDLGVGGGDALLTRLVLLLVGALGALAFLALVPRREGWFTRMGTASLVVYLGHGFAVKAAVYAGFADWASHDPWLGLAVATIGGAALALLLAWSPVSRRLQMVVDPIEAAQQQLDRAVRLHRVAHEAPRERERDQVMA